MVATCVTTEVAVGVGVVVFVVVGVAVFVEVVAVGVGVEVDFSELRAGVIVSPSIDPRLSFIPLTLHSAHTV